jgi:polyphenol oxidase
MFSHVHKSFAISRRSIVKGGAALAGVSALGLATRSVHSQTAPRVRMDIATFAQDAGRVARFEAAVKQMQDASARNPRDPAGWLANANVHLDFCAMPGGPGDPAQIHFCWWFLAWHRAYISVTERKIRQISGDDSFTYPYWNWSTDRRIPAAYGKRGSPLANAVRFTRNSGLNDDEVGLLHDDPAIEQLGVAALAATFFEAKTADDIGVSFGGIARPNPENAYDNNAIEGTPHGSVHVYVGGQTSRRAGDMSDFSTAARDPIFFAHHGNLDRLWETWRRDPARKATEPTTDAFQNHAFVFPWLDGTHVQVPMSDILDTTKLGYTYDYLDVNRPQAIVMAEQAAPEPLPPIATQKLAVPLAQQGADDGSRKFLEITGIAKPDTLLSVSVVIKPAGAPASERGIEVGHFSAVLNGGKIDWPSGRLVFDITSTARKFGGQDITVELIPHRIGPDADQSFPPLKYDKMNIVTKRR